MPGTKINQCAICKKINMLLTQGNQPESEAVPGQDQRSGGG